ncbi:hypothetical protein [Halococcoides cellulosivorans]|uniref:Uncharacterized protein n=1 Tax=Halococcoides cellulosivorans TaxID=1679096 RepID=A0A2R4X2R2_9EURY|nr:hypothetical protein [Halococcoides cellulosivorans]AWB28064.1 hypothetical protein HARCEL1_10270 [Halococcoides cellulosivorans]
MSLPGTIDTTVYRGLRDVLERQPEITTVTYEPDSIVKRSLRATVAADRVRPSTGPADPTLDVEWRFRGDEQFYRIHYADPNTGFNCGYHRDADHPDLGPVHFQYQVPDASDTHHEASSFDPTIPTEILWIALEELFERRIRELLG